MVRLVWLFFFLKDSKLMLRLFLCFHQAHSIGSAPSSLGSQGSKRFSRRYRTVNMRSEVDENLFGTPNRIKQAQSMRDKKSS
jgi:hypothetical protein